MYITNPQIIKNKIICGKVVADYLKSKNICPFSFEKGKYYFVNSSIVEELLGNPPFTIKLAIRFGL